MKYYLVRIIWKDGTQGYYTYKTNLKVKKKDLVFVKTQFEGIVIGEISCETMAEDEFINAIEETVKTKLILEKLDLRDGKIYFKGKLTSGIYDENLKRYDKKKTWFSRIFG